ncbi:DUF3558 domain-containing protein [Williamsia serinedens]|uniref:DUF3558 domain-containing protein n=1 Tax=Williamsia serinedens TaxID=391736 RepID=UPI0020A519C7|nr:DUF3558 domain-containing protein [Williamsia serinedens]
MQTRAVRRSTWVLVLVAVVALIGACSDDSGGGSTTRGAGTSAAAGSGPFFGACGGVSTDDVARATGTSGLITASDNSAGCEWVTSADILGPQFSFNWYRGSPIARERATEQLSRDTVSDLTIDGHSGFIASSAGICEIGIAFGADFFEWSVSYGTAEPGQQQRSADEVCQVTKALSTMSIERAK